MVNLKGVEMKDVIVIGAGWAGVIAARQLSEAGLSVQVLEARDRVGGRVWYDKLDPEIDLKVELGGTYMPPGESCTPRMKDELARYGFETQDAHVPEVNYWWLQGRLIEGGLPVDFDKIKELERLLFFLARDAKRLLGLDYPDATVADLDVSPLQWLRDNGIDGDTYELLLAEVVLYLGGKPDEISMMHILWWIALLGGDVWTMYTAPSAKIGGGSQTLVATIAKEAGLDIQFNRPVVAVRQDEDGVRVELNNGEELTARRVVVAAPLNVWKDIEFSPNLSEPKQALVREGHGGLASKYWAVVRNCPDFGAVGWGLSAQWVTTEYTIPEGRVIVGFGVEDLDEGESIEAFRKTILTYAPEAEVVKVRKIDWVNDPYSKGGWAASRPGQMTGLGDQMRTAEGKIYFASSDIARTYHGWMEGAIDSAIEASSALVADLARVSA